MVYLNRDGSRAAMCGNGLRCVAHFASTILFPGKQLLSISTDCGIRRAFVKDDLVEVEMGSIGPPCIRTIALQNQKFTVSWINSGVPHAVLMVRDIDRVQVESIGKMIRNHEAFIPSGTNVTFTEQRKIPGIDLSFRTYERGVESETLACGTGAVAAAVISWDLFPQESCLRLQCASKEILRVRREFEKDTFWYFLQGKVSCLGTV
jgi:diaminopimelate epimerase